VQAQKFAQNGGIEVAIGVTSITGRGSDVVDFDWDRGWMFQLWSGRKWKKCVWVENEGG